MGRRRIISCSAEETVAFGRSLSKELKGGDVLCLFGTLGSGKTTLIKGIVSGFGQVEEHAISSPTFTYLQSYGTLHHFDLYRLAGVEAFQELGFEEYLYSEEIVCIEWSERIASILPKGAMKISLSHYGEGKRLIEVEAALLEGDETIDIP